MKLHRDIKVSQKTAWYMLPRLRESWDLSELSQLLGPVEVDETYVGGSRKNMSKSKRKELKGRGTANKTPVIGVKDRNSKHVIAKVIKHTDMETLHDFIHTNVEPKATVYTDDHGGYNKLRGYTHETIRHSVGEYVRDEVHTNGIESFWSMLKRAHKGTYHKMSAKHPQRYINEFSGRQRAREHDTAKQMQDLVTGLIGKRLMYRDLVK